MMVKIICDCGFGVELTKDELYGEKYILCLCGNLFLNINYCMINKAYPKIITEKNTTFR